MSQGRTPWCAMSTMRCRITSGSGRPLTNIPPSWLRPPWPGGGGGMNTYKCHGTRDMPTSLHYNYKSMDSHTLWREKIKSTMKTYFSRDTNFPKRSMVKVVSLSHWQWIHTDTPALLKQTRSLKQSLCLYECMFKSLTHLMVQIIMGKVAVKKKHIKDKRGKK